MKGSRRGVDKRPEYGVHWTSRRKERVPDEMGKTDIVHRAGRRYAAGVTGAGGPQLSRLNTDARPPAGQARAGIFAP